MCNRILHDCIHVSIASPLRFGHVCNRETRQPWSEYRLEIPWNFHFCGPEKKAVKLAKK